MHIIESHLSYYEVCVAVEAVAQRLGLKVLGQYDLAACVADHEDGLDEACCVFELLGAAATQRLLAEDLRCSAFLPWRLSVYTEHGVTRMALYLPPLESLLPGASEARKAALAVQEKLMQLLQEIR